jgi:hypothetical protein
MATIIAKGAVVSNASDNTIANAQFVYCVATSTTQDITVKDASGTTLGVVPTILSGDVVIIEKAPTDTITFAGKSTPVGSPRS